MNILERDLSRVQRGGLLVGILLLLGAVGVRGETPSEAVAFPLEEISGFDVVNMGHACVCGHEPEPNIVYPAFSSGRPLHGVMDVDGEFANPGSGTAYPFALDESGGTGAGYDRLYIDLNRDGRLADETPIAPLRELPTGLMFKGKWHTPPVWFGSVTFTSKDTGGTHSVETLPRLLIDKQGFATLSFTATKARRGRIEIAGRPFHVTIVNEHPLGTRWDRPGTTVTLDFQGGSRMPYWFGSNRLMAMHRIGDRYWRLSLTPTGDRLSVAPYQGPLGVFEVDMGGWPFRRTTFVGALLAKDKVVAVGQVDPHGNYRAARSCEVPVGDYAPISLDVGSGPLVVSLTNNGYATGTSGRRDPNSFYTLPIRPDKPCLLDFSRKGEILFLSPAPGTRLKPGDELAVMTVLVDPQSQAMIRVLRRQAHEEASPTILLLIGLLIVGPLAGWVAAGRSRPQYRYLPLVSGIGLLILTAYLGGLFALNALLYPEGSRREKYQDLTPQVTIARAGGEIVTWNPQPPGRGGLRTWRVPNDFKPSGKEETLTIKVNYDTRELYGTVTASREIKVCR